MPTTRTRTDRIYLRISPELKKEMMEYCRRHHAVLSDVVVRFFLRLLQKEKEETNVDAEQV